MRHPFIRTLAGQKDPYFKNTTLLLHGDGTNGGQNNTFVDGSTNNFTITRNGNTTQGTFSPYGDNWSNYFDGNGDWLSLPASSAYDFGTGDFTIEAWFYLTGNASANNGGVRDAAIFAVSTTSIAICLVIIGNTTTTGTAIQLFKSTGSTVNLFRNVTIAQNTWHHVAVTKQSGSVKFFLNGEQQGGSDSDSNTWGSSSATAKVGSLQITGFLDYFPGYISGLRVLKGTAQYTANFTPPTAPLTAITNTSLLTCQSNRFRDASTNNFTITRNGDVSVQRFSPFSPTAAYAAGTIGGSGYFDGTGDYLQLTGGDGFNLTGDFTVEAWIYRTATGSQRIVGKWNLTGNLAWVLETSTTAIGFGVANSGTFSASLSFSATINLFAWNHVAVSRSGSTVRAFLNGADLGSATSSANCTANNTNPIQIGQTENVNYVNGYVCDVRVLKGTAQYTAAFTPPTAPLSAITNTSLLLNFTNAAILDNAMMAVPETVGNAQISTSVKKYGTGSLYFDGNGDYISLPKSNLLDFGAGDFTVEFWYYGVGSGDGILFLSGNSNSYAGFRMADGYLLLSSNGGGWITTSLNWTAPSAGLWTHYAATRSGSSIMVFLNGVLTKSFTTSESLYSAGTQYTVGRYQENASTYYYTNGYIDDLRITKGVARYTSNFIPPTAPFPDF